MAEEHKPKELSKDLKGMKFMSRLNENNRRKTIQAAMDKSEKELTWGVSSNSHKSSQSYMDFSSIEKRRVSGGRRSFGSFNKKIEALDQISDSEVPEDNVDLTSSEMADLYKKRKIAGMDETQAEIQVKKQKKSEKDDWSQFPGTTATRFAAGKFVRPTEFTIE